MYKSGKDSQLSCNPHLKVKQPLLLIINAWALCRAWWNDIKNTVVHCADCCSCVKALALAEFGRGIWSWSRLVLNWKQRCVKDLFANWRGAYHYYSSILCSTYRTYGAGVWWKLICMNSNFEGFCGHLLVASQNFLAHQHQADGKLTFYGRNDWISSCFELVNRLFFLPPWT